MKIGELSKRTGLSPHAIRFYEREGLIASRPSQETSNNYRDYPEQLVESLSFIVSARNAGLSVSELREMNTTLCGECDPEAGLSVVENKIEQLERTLLFLNKIKAEIVALTNVSA